MSFAQRLLESFPKIEIGLVPCAVGGSSLDRWREGGFLYERALMMTRYAQQFGTVKGILWHQGESDAGNSEKADTYAERLIAMFSAFRRDAGIGNVPIVLGELADFLNKQKQTFWETVNRQLHIAAAEIPNTAVVNADGFGHIGDDLHLDAASQRVFGRRYAAAYLQLVEADGGVDRQPGD